MNVQKQLVAVALCALPLTHVTAESVVSRAIENGNISAEAFGGYHNSSVEINTFERDASDFDIDILRLGFSTQIDKDLELGIELEWDTGDNAEDSSETKISDLFIAQTYGNTVVTLGRFKQIVNRERATELSDRIVASEVDPFDGLIDIAKNEPSLGLPPGYIEALQTGMVGVRRRIDGIEIKHTYASGFNTTLSAYKGGIDNTDGDTDRNYGYAGSIGWQGGTDDLHFGFTVGAFQEDGNENDDDPAITGDLTSVESSAFAVRGNIGFGPVLGAINYTDGEVENDIDSVSTDDIEFDRISVLAAWNIAGAQRQFDEYGVVQGPKLAQHARGYELALSFSATDTEMGNLEEAELDTYSVGFNMYYGSYTKISFSYSDQELDFGNNLEVEADQFAISVRVDY